MKYIFPLALILIFSSCTKNKKYCWKCTVTYYGTTTFTGTTTICNKTKDEINRMAGLRFESSNPDALLEEYSNCSKN